MAEFKYSPSFVVRGEGVERNWIGDADRTQITKSSRSGLSSHVRPALSAFSWSWELCC
jgi:hypothetical protein